MNKKNLLLNILVPTLLLSSLIGVMAFYTGDKDEKNNNVNDGYTVLSKANLNPVIPTPDSFKTKNKVDNYSEEITNDLEALKLEYIQEENTEKVLVIKEIKELIGSQNSIDYSNIPEEKLKDLVGFSNYLYHLYNKEDSEFKIDAIKQGLNCIVGEQPEKLAKITGTLDAMGVPAEEYVKDLITELNLETIKNFSVLKEALDILEGTKEKTKLKSKAIEEVEKVLVSKISSESPETVIDFLNNSFVCEDCLANDVSKSKLAESILNNKNSSTASEDVDSKNSDSSENQGSLKPLPQSVTDLLESYLPNTPNGELGGSEGGSSASDGGSVGEGSKGQGKTPNNDSLPQTGHSETSNYGLILIYFSLYFYIRSKNYKSLSK